jgi:hypothetical protein
MFARGCRSAASRRVASRAQSGRIGVCSLTRLGPEALAMMVVCARVERTLTRAWTFTPEKAEVVDMRAAILMLRAVDGTVRFGCWNGDRRTSPALLDAPAKR